MSGERVGLGLGPLGSIGLSAFGIDLFFSYAGLPHGVTMAISNFVVEPAGVRVLIDPLRTRRLLRHSAWLARRWDDPAFPIAFPWFDSPRYWQEHVTDLEQQLAALKNIN